MNKALNQLNYKNMVARYKATIKLDEKNDNDRYYSTALWNALGVMRENGFISDDVWSKFFDTCKSF